MEMNYHGHKIQAVSREKPDSDPWDVEINVLYPEADGDKNQRFEGPLDGFRVFCTGSNYFLVRLATAASMVRAAPGCVEGHA